MIRLPRRRRSSDDFEQHPLGYMPLKAFHRHVRTNLDAPATWAQLIAEAATEPTARGNR